LKILVYEHTVGGGFAGEELPASILPEGYGMLRSLVSDLSRAGYRTVTLIDARCRSASSLLQADQIISISSKEQLTRTFSKTLESVDAACVIAPESDETLETFVRKTKEKGILSLNCSPDSIHTSSDKAVAFRLLKNAGLHVPETRIIDLREDHESVREHIGVGTPFILKPQRGVNCSGLSVVTNENEAKTALTKIKRTSNDHFAMAQEIIQGTAASVNVICTSEGASPLTLNQQFVRLSPPNLESAYLGGLVPLQHDLQEKALEAAVRTIETFPGLSGYVGVDMVLTEEEPFIIDINPRLTTSYVGARRVLKLNLGHAIVQGASNGELPRHVRASGYAVFYKAPAAWFLAGGFRKESLQLDVVSPSLQSDKDCRFLVLGYTKTIVMARKAYGLLAEAERN